jgi:hypothetical protein
MRRHSELQSLLAIAHDRSEKEEKQLQQHLAICAECRDMAGRYQQQDEILRRVEYDAPPAGLSSAVLRSVSGRRRRRRFPPALPSARTLASSTITALAILVLAFAVISHRHPAVHEPLGSPIGASVTTAARELAQRLGITGRPVVGNEAYGQGRPWYVWLPTDFRSGRPALFTSSYGAQGEFHYFALGPIAGHRTDTFHGRVTDRQLIMVAGTWLKHAGVRVPPGEPHVSPNARGTIIGGTGLCCYARLNSVFWSGANVEYHAVVVYVADGRTVVQADVAPAAPILSQLGGCVPHIHVGHGARPPGGVALGIPCFGYSDAARAQMNLSLGGHQPEMANPIWVASRFGIGARPALAHGRPVLAQASASGRTYRFQYTGRTYAVSVVPAFPGLRGTVWEVAEVQAIR